MKKINLYPHQIEAVEYLKQFNNCLIGDDMGLGKTFEGSEMLDYYNNKINLVVCQKSKVNDWINHFNKYYDFKIFDLTDKKQLTSFIDGNIIEQGSSNDIFKHPKSERLKEFLSKIGN